MHRPIVVFTRWTALRLAGMALLGCLFCGSVAEARDSQAGARLCRKSRDTFQPEPLDFHPLKPSNAHKHNDRNQNLPWPYAKNTKPNLKARPYHPRSNGYVTPRPHHEKRYR